MASFLFKLIIFLFNLLLYLYNPDLSIIYCLSIPIVPDYKLRDSKGKFKSPNQEDLKPIIPLSKEIMDPLIGNLLGDGSLRFTHKGLDGKPKLNSNALYAMTLKDRDYVYHI